MAISLYQIGEWLDGIGFNFHHDESSELIVFEYGPTGHFIRTREEGKLFCHQVQILDFENQKHLSVDKDHKCIKELLQYMAESNYRTAFGTWEYDSESGDVRFAVEIPLMNSTMTEEQFKRAFDMIINICHIDVPNIVKISNCEEPESIEDMILKQAIVKALKEEIGEEGLGKLDLLDPSTNRKGKDNNDWGDGI